jgi:hypothetical protein
LTEHRQKLRKRAMILHRKLAPTTRRNPIRIKKARTDIAAERHSGGIMFDLRTLFERQSQ